jgi:isopenicillin N synthase-like dioxygenase
MGSIESPTPSGNASGTFTSIPVLSLAKARNPATKGAFLKELQNALLHVGFLYLSDTGVSNELVGKVCEQTKLFFDESVLPVIEKEAIEMKNEKSFLGWSRVSAL